MNSVRSNAKKCHRRSARNVRAQLVAIAGGRPATDARLLELLICSAIYPCKVPRSLRTPRWSRPEVEAIEREGERLASEFWGAPPAP